MKKKDLVKAARKGFPRTEDMVNSLFLALNTAFINKETVTIEHFGKFWAHKSKVHRGYDFQKREWYPIDGRYTIKFKPCTEIKRRMNT